MADVNRDGAAGTTVRKLKDFPKKRQFSDDCDDLSSGGFVKKSGIDVRKDKELTENAENVENISFWPMSFREQLDVLKKPFVLHSETQRTSGLCYTKFTLSLSKTTIDLISKSRVTIKNKAGKEVEGFFSQICLRFGHLPTTENGSVELDDLFPKDLSISINGEAVSLNRNKLASDRIKYSRPLEVTRLINLKDSENEIGITWSEDLSCGGSKKYVLGVYLLALQRIEFIRNWITAQPFIPKLELLRKVWETSNEEVQTKTKVSILCPITMKKIKLPCRGLRCQHYSCFELTSFLELNLNAKRFKYICPICNEAVKLEEIRIDEYLHDALHLLEKYKKDAIWIDEEGSWQA